MELTKTGAASAGKLAFLNSLETQAVVPHVPAAEEAAEKAEAPDDKNCIVM